MLFEVRDLKPYAEMVSRDSLEVGNVYFAVNYDDAEMLVPTMEPKVFIGRDLEADEPGCYFQDFDSYRRGIRFDPASETTKAIFEVGTESHLFDYEHALDELMRCELRRRNA